MTGDYEAQGRESVAARLARVFPELMRCQMCGARRPRTWIDGVEYELDEDGEWVVVED